MLTESVVDANSPGHSLLTLNSGEHFGGVLESDRSFTQGVADGEQIDESSQERSAIAKDHRPLDKLTIPPVQDVPLGPPFY